MIGVNDIVKFAVISVVLVVVANFAIGGIGGSAVKAFDLVKEKLGLAPPSIAMFEVTPNPDGKSLTVRYAILNSGDVREVNFYRQYRKYSDDAWSSLRSGVYGEPFSLSARDLKNQLDDHGKVILDDPPLPLADSSKGIEAGGMHLFTLEASYVTKEGAASATASDELYLYDEAYLEYFKGEINGKHYDVIECKTELISGNLIGTPYAADISDRECERDVGYYKGGGYWFRWCAEVFMPENPSCNCLKEGLEGCTADQVDALDFEASRMWMWRAACLGEDGRGFSVNPKSSLKDYEAVYKNLNEDKLFQYVQEGIYSRVQDKTKRGVLVCSNTVKDELGDLGFVPLEENGRAGRAEAVLRGVLKGALS